MVIKTELIKNVSADILSAVDTSEVSNLTDTLCLYTENNSLFATVSNGEYVVQVKLADSVADEFRASVNAKLFLKLVSQITTEDIDLTVKDNSLVIRGNGKYHVPVVYDENGDVIAINKITIENVQCSMNIDSSILRNILKFNSKQIADVSRIRTPIQSLYYVDNEGAITFTDGATVNNFSLDAPVNLLITSKIVKLFKLFSEGTVKFKMGHDVDEIGNTVLKVNMENDTVSLTYISVSDDSLVKAFPVEAIRNRANAVYPYSVNINRVELLQSINRLLVFTNAVGGRLAMQPSAHFVFYADRLEISDTFTENEELKNRESIKYLGTTINASEPYRCVLNLNDVSNAISTCVDPYTTVAFGDSQAVVIKRGSVVDVIAQCDLD